MKLLILLLAAAGLSGCAVYPATGYDGYGYGNVNSYGNGYDSTYPVYSNSYPYGYGAVSPVVVPPPVYIYGSGVYGNNNGYRRPYPYARPGVRPPGYNQGNQGNHGSYGDRRPGPQRQEARPGDRVPGGHRGEAPRPQPQPQFRNDGSRLGRFLQGDSNEPGRR